MMNSKQQLERSALDCHRRGIGWNDFWRQHGAAVAQAEPFNRGGPPGGIRFFLGEAKPTRFPAIGGTLDTVFPFFGRFLGDQ